MTAAGLAFIAGGLATLISFRAVLFGGETEPERPRQRGRRQRAAPPAPDSPPAGADAGDPPAGRPARRRRLAAAFAGRDDVHADEGPAFPDLAPPDLAFPDLAPPDPAFLRHADDLGAGPFGDESGAYPAMPWGDEEMAGDEPAGEASRYIDNTAWRTDPAAADPPQAGDDVRYDRSYAPPRQAIDRSDRAYGDRIDGWVRPRYRDLDDRPPAGDYWTPVPDDRYADPEPSARAYGWPVPVERLPSVPDYEPATGFDLTPMQAAEPTTLVPTWPPPSPDHRIRLPRSWSDRDRNLRDAADRDRDARDAAGRDLNARDAADRDRDPRDAAGRDLNARGAAERDWDARDAAERGWEARDAAERGWDARDAAERGWDARDAAERDWNARDAAERDSWAPWEQPSVSRARIVSRDGRSGPRAVPAVNRDEPSWNDPSRRSRRSAGDPRPRPRPRPAAVDQDYVSRHSAGPHR
ncbi:Halomucin [Actinoplanes sp. SE50]|nr:Halomucin [Actinoplanes sp. SE50/110]ATO87002.1 Halomucin [Actinoplanes sp. SE50]SLM04420.1 Halomucin [Actinoplanes sp. SE50/110]